MFCHNPVPNSEGVKYAIKLLQKLIANTANSHMCCIINGVISLCYKMTIPEREREKGGEGREIQNSNTEVLLLS